MKLITTTMATPNDLSALGEMFRARKAVFVDFLGWDIPVLGGEFELDQFDTPSARYLVLIDDNGRHRASTRLLPTTAPHLLDSLFSELCEEELPRGPDILEITRFCIDLDQTAIERRETRNLLVSAIADFAVAHRIKTYTGVAGLGWMRQIRSFGWRCRPLGQPRQSGDQMLAALRIDIDTNTIPQLTRTGVYTALAQRDDRRAA